ncbi:hypothetical protein M8C21_006005 [Ambrosia artemisiifolia]|uniref:Bifunctional inhibitor/plant lipid transfer protein/seed storage helical domain-containing protein n=1 Tax=Ambrosia artemisiifolia TaxID=4212 RepID=A0AAD5GBR4_AMBAR|nr:hypothetical protein M8C21_006005 [Ambrosia artemisiifolia]
MLVLMGHGSAAVNCNYMELMVCAGAVTSHQPPSSDCCAKVKEQKTCFCGYLQNPTIRQYVTPQDAQRVAKQCGVTLPNC